MERSKLLIRLIVLSTLLSACASTGPRRSGDPPVIGVGAGHCIGIYPDDAIARDIAASPHLKDLGALAYDPGTGTLYGISEASRAPKLITLDRATGEAAVIGPIAPPEVKLRQAEALAFNPADDLLYVAAGTSTYASNLLLTLDPTTRKAREIARIRGTTQDDVDALAFADGVLYAADATGGASVLYTLDPKTGEARRLGSPIPKFVTDLAFDAVNRRLLAAVDAERLLIAISLDGETVTEIGPMSVKRRFEPEFFVALVAISESSKFLTDGFESGDLSGWSRAGKPGGG